MKLIIKNKKCVWCSTMFKPFQTTQRACSVSCARKWTAQRKAEQQAHLELFDKERKLKKRVASTLQSTRLIIHEYIRERDRYKPCISCDAPWRDNFQAGHYYKAELYSTLKFHFLNIHGQCRKCNLKLDGNLNGYSTRLPYRIGKTEFNKLVKIAEEEKRIDFHWDLDELKEIRVLATRLLKELKQSGFNR